MLVVTGWGGGGMLTGDCYVINLTSKQQQEGLAWKCCPFCHHPFRNNTLHKNHFPRKNITSKTGNWVCCHGLFHRGKVTEPPHGRTRRVLLGPSLTFTFSGWGVKHTQRIGEAPRRSELWLLVRARKRLSGTHGSKQHFNKMAISVLSWSKLENS